MKPREFWIDDKVFDLGWERVFVAEHPHKDSLADSIHVIEKSAYDALMAEAVKLISALTSSYGNVHYDAMETFDKFIEGLK